MIKNIDFKCKILFVNLSLSIYYNYHLILDITIHNGSPGRISIQTIIRTIYDEV